MKTCDCVYIINIIMLSHVGSKLSCRQRSSARVTQWTRQEDNSVGVFDDESFSMPWKQQFAGG